MDPEKESSTWYMTNYVGFAGYTALVWDHLITFSLEVELIWGAIRKGERKPLFFLFLINRYLIPIGFIMNLFAYLSSTLSWDPATCREGDVHSCRCQRFVRFEGALTMIGIDVAALMMFIRIYALYHKGGKVIICGVAALLAVQIGVNAWLLTLGTAVQHENVPACTMIFGTAQSWIASSTAWIPLMYDSVVLALTIYKTFPRLHKGQLLDPPYIMRKMLEGGILYYRQVCFLNWSHNALRLKAPDELKNICAQLELLITVMMMSRITLNLRNSGHKEKKIGKKLNDLGHVSTLISATAPSSPISPNTQYPPWNSRNLHTDDPRYPDPSLSPDHHKSGVVIHIEHTSIRDDDYPTMFASQLEAGPGLQSTRVPASHLPSSMGEGSYWA
ncbi:hypothetical protein K435DRAFT_962187 [Dendrothele bispora CBS 962.96]|uniref:DUF6533 domain-containing protein n=1 Tax=Dendrothele bispora (strain CBS 962.96) TaxID=1314807 RepID=A0A4S8MLQ5_DENBC|nr:hypothetical protein K435DRAFT_962187 [Dendrothele bispora CBS 962.96]